MKVNKNIMGEFGHQIDLLNTLGGGISTTSVDITHTPQGFVIRMKTPSLSSESYNIEISQNQLVIYAVLPSQAQVRPGQAENAKRVVIPSFLKTFPLPDSIDKNGIEAVSEDGELRIIVPLKPQVEETPRKIDIRQI